MSYPFERNRPKKLLALKEGRTATHLGFLVLQAAIVVFWTYACVAAAPPDKVVFALFGGAIVGVILAAFLSWILASIFAGIRRSVRAPTMPDTLSGKSGEPGGQSDRLGGPLGFGRQPSKKASGFRVDE